MAKRSSKPATPLAFGFGGSSVDSFPLILLDRHRAVAAAKSSQAKHAREGKAKKMKLRRKRIQAAVEERMRANKNNSRTQARREAAAKLTKKFGRGYSYDVVMEHDKKNSN
jgi:hypothetical protein